MAVAVAVALVLPLTACSAIGLASPDSTGEVARAILPAADIIPESGALFGVNLDWGVESLQEFSDRLGLEPAVAVSFTHLPMSETDLVNVRGAADQVRAGNGTLLLTLEPHAGLAVVTPEIAGEVATLLAEFNASGVPVVVRFAHEMNGSWYAWGQQPSAYIAAYRTVAMAVHRLAPGSSMMWAPNYAGGYPFTGGSFAAAPGSADYAALDTSGDGVLTLDEAYAPYYPGDDVVDWVGLSLYHWGSAHPWGESEIPEAGKFAAQLTGTYSGYGGDDTSAPDFYQTYAVEHGKALGIPETAALVVADGDPDLERSIKQAWWRQVFSEETATRFPQLHMINWFEWNKFEPEVGDDVDWTLGETDDVLSAFVDDLPAWVIPAHLGEGNDSASSGLG
ncbi:glycosyl hydrolase [Salinibacterium sp. G-O1]|uniref:glycoside hydrolase family 26 protein n=1 Tax=Salinibacterium sp. G-O1 TaxID=3046208 RepID=UPI0024B9F7BB|nr:glycosyl hydrolase [Salinibacterium sp. G-O1]MDJ0335343.1 glycosyl hydrolase [Salinibacterium sp. G-O1]